MSSLESNGDFMRKTRSIYCTDSEYQRLKNALALIRVYDNLGPLAFSEKAFVEQSFWKIVKGIDEYD